MRLTRLATMAVLIGAVGAGATAVAAPADAHPLGNATVNHYDGLHLYPDHVSDQAVEDIAEIPTLQRKPRIDRNDDNVLSAAERRGYAVNQCRDLARTNRITVDGQRIELTVTRASYAERPGVINLKVGRLTCDLTGPAKLSAPAAFGIDASWDSAGIGWHEITATATSVVLHTSPFPARSVSDTLLHYPNDMLSSPLDVRSGSIRTTPGAGPSTYDRARHIAGAGWATRILNRISTTFNNLVGARHLTLGVGLLAVLLSMVLGAGHAFLPGHGKTIMAAYLVGRRGRLRDVVAVGATVTVTHTAGVLILGLLISVSSAFAPTAAEQYLGIVSGLIVAGVGVGLLISAVRRRHPATLTGLDTHEHPHGHGHPHEHGVGHSHDDSAANSGSDFATPATAAAVPSMRGRQEEPLGSAAGSMTIAVSGSQEHDGHSHGPHEHPHGQPQKHSHDSHEHSHGHPHEHSDDSHEHSHGHSHGHPHLHGHSHEGASFGKGGLLGLGVAGGLVPSPSALLVLLAAIALGRAWLGIVLVLGYGLGMATALTCAGLLLVQLRNRLSTIALRRNMAAANKLAAALPILTATLVLVVGIGLTLRAVHGSI